MSGAAGGMVAADPIRRKRGRKQRMGVALQSSLCRTSLQASIRVNPQFDGCIIQRHLAVRCALSPKMGRAKTSHFRHLTPGIC